MAEDVDQVALMNFRTERTIAIVGAVLMTIKFIAFFVTGSVSILTDALESIVNVVAGIIGVYALWMCLAPADRSHPYGHGKLELLSSASEGMMILVAGALIIVESVDRFMNPEGVRDIDFGLAIVIFAAIVNFIMGANAIRRGKKYGSIALVASGKHLCTDTYSSVGIIIGLLLMCIFGAFGIDAWWLDPLTAALFGAFIIYTGIGVVLNSAHGIIDAADDETLTVVTRALNHARTPELIDIHHLRVIRYGPMVHVEAHMVVPDDIAQGAVDRVRRQIIDQIISAMGNGVDVTLQAESCDYKCCEHCMIEGCGHRSQPFTSNVILNLDTVTSKESSSKKGFLHDDEPRHASVRRK